MLEQTEPPAQAVNKLPQQSFAAALPSPISSCPLTVAAELPEQ